MAFLTVDIHKPPFKTLAELAEVPEYKLGTLGGTAWLDEMRVRGKISTKHVLNIFPQQYPVIEVLERSEIRNFDTFFHKFSFFALLKSTARFLL